MDKAKKYQNKYDEYCLGCHSKTKEFGIISCGRGMDNEMLNDFGRNKIAIDCTLCNGWLALELTEPILNKLSRGKFRTLGLGSAGAEKAKTKIRAKDIQKYLDTNPRVKTKIYSPCTILSPQI